MDGLKTTETTEIIFFSTLIKFVIDKEVPQFLPCRYPHPPSSPLYHYLKIWVNFLTFFCPNAYFTLKTCLFEKYRINDHIKRAYYCKHLESVCAERSTSTSQRFFSKTIASFFSTCSTIHVIALHFRLAGLVQLGLKKDISQIRVLRRKHVL